MSFNVTQFLQGLEGEGRRRALAAGVLAVDQFAEQVVGKAQDLAPVETGALKRSAVAEKAQSSGGGGGGGGITAVIGFNTDYAAAVHERLEAHHDQGESKYLEKAMRRKAHKLKPFVEKEMRKAL